MSSPKYFTAAMQISHQTRPARNILAPIAAPNLGPGTSYHNQNKQVQSISRLLRAQHQSILNSIHINSIYGSFGYSSGSGKSHFSRLYGGGYGYSYHRNYGSGYRIHAQTREIKYFSAEQINEMISNYNTSDEYNIFEENYASSSLFPKKYDAAVFDLKEAIKLNQKILDQFKKRKYQSQSYNRKNYKFEGYQNNKFEQIANLQTRILAEQTINDLKKEIEQIATDHPEWLI